jgi:hypothetical protein
MRFVIPNWIHRHIKTKISATKKKIGKGVLDGMTYATIHAIIQGTFRNGL